MPKQINAMPMKIIILSDAFQALSKHFTIFLSVNNHGIVSIKGSLRLFERHSAATASQ